MDKYTLYLDESETSNSGRKPTFVIAGIVIKDEYQISFEYNIKRSNITNKSFVTSFIILSKLINCYNRNLPFLL